MSESSPEKRCRAEFTCDAPNASSVFLVGTFDGRKMRPAPMSRGADGEWTAVLQLPPGQYEYKFIAVYHRQIHVREDGPYGTLNYVAAPFSEAAGTAA